jgi:hypothetical protein
MKISSRPVARADPQARASACKTPRGPGIYASVLQRVDLIRPTEMPPLGDRRSSSDHILLRLKPSVCDNPRPVCRGPVRTK